MTEGRLGKQVAVVTGGSQGIGRCIAARLGREGATALSLDVIAPDVSASESETDRIRTPLIDVSDERRVREAFAIVREEYDGVDVLVNNAGLFTGLDRGPFWELSSDMWDRVMHVNRSAFLCAREASTSMRASGRGGIVNIASTAASFGVSGLLRYVTSKAAIVGMTRRLARELGPFGITVNAVAPGLVTTEVTERTISADRRHDAARTQVIGQAISGDDVAEAVGYLCSPAARLVTGQVLPVNGGSIMGAAW